MAVQHPQIIPMLSYENGVAAMDWLCRVFGFSEQVKMVDDDGVLMHGEITLGTGVIMLATPTGLYESPKRHREKCADTAKYYTVPYVINGVMVAVADVRQHYQHAVEQGATLLSPLEEGGPGLLYRAEDLEGQRWMFIEVHNSSAG